MFDLPKTLISRRTLFGWLQAALATVVSPAALASVPIAGETAAGDDYYAKLGVEKIINAAGTYTYLTAAVMPEPVRRAVAQAALRPVVLKELQDAAGKYIAQRLRCESALITSGASAALTLRDRSLHRRRQRRQTGADSAGGLVDPGRVRRHEERGHCPAVAPL